MEDFSNIITFPESEYHFYRNYFIIYDINGIKHKLSVYENFTNKYIPHENIMQKGIINNYLRIVGGDDNHVIPSFQNIFIPTKFSGEITIEYYKHQKFHYPVVLSSINHDLFCERFDYGKSKSNLTPLQEIMFQDIITIIKRFLNEDDLEKYFNEIFEDGYDVLNYTQEKCYGAIEMIEKYINGIMFEAMNYLINTFEYKFHLIHLPHSIQIQCE